MTGTTILTAMARELSRRVSREPAGRGLAKAAEQHAESSRQGTEQCSPAPCARSGCFSPVPVAEALTRPSLIFGVKPAHRAVERKAEPKPASPESQLPLLLITA